MGTVGQEYGRQEKECGQCVRAAESANLFENNRIVKTVNTSTTGIMHIIIELLLCLLHAPGVPASHFLGVTPPSRAGHGQVFLNIVHQVLSSLLLATSKSPAATRRIWVTSNKNASCRHQQR